MLFANFAILFYIKSIYTKLLIIYLSCLHINLMILRFMCLHYNPTFLFIPSQILYLIPLSHFQFDKFGDQM